MDALDKAVSTTKANPLVVFGAMSLYKPFLLDFYHDFFLAEFSFKFEIKLEKKTPKRHKQLLFLGLVYSFGNTDIYTICRHDTHCTKSFCYRQINYMYRYICIYTHADFFIKDDVWVKILAVMVVLIYLYSNNNSYCY